VDELCQGIRHIQNVSRLRGTRVNVMLFMPVRKVPLCVCRRLRNSAHAEQHEVLIPHTEYHPVRTQKNS
jgi:hypothetical protein